MAKPITQTPVLRGVDAVNFLEKIEINKEKKVSKEYITSVRESYAKIRKLLKS